MVSAILSRQDSLQFSLPRRDSRGRFPREIPTASARFAQKIPAERPPRPVVTSRGDSRPFAAIRPEDSHARLALTVFSRRFPRNVGHAEIPAGISAIRRFPCEIPAHSPRIAGEIPVARFLRSSAASPRFERRFPRRDSWRFERRFPREDSRGDSRAFPASREVAGTSCRAVVGRGESPAQPTEKGQGV